MNVVNFKNVFVFGLLQHGVATAAGRFRDLFDAIQR